MFRVPNFWPCDHKPQLPVEESAQKSEDNLRPDSANCFWIITWEKSCLNTNIHIYICIYVYVCVHRHSIHKCMCTYTDFTTMTLRFWLASAEFSKDPSRNHGGRTGAMLLGRFSGRLHGWLATRHCFTATLSNLELCRAASSKLPAATPAEMSLQGHSGYRHQHFVAKIAAKIAQDHSHPAQVRER